MRNLKWDLVPWLSLCLNTSLTRPNPTKGSFPENRWLLSHGLALPNVASVAQKFALTVKLFNFNITSLRCTLYGAVSFLTVIYASTWTKAEHLLLFKVCGVSVLLGFNPTATKQPKATFYCKFWGQMKYKSSQQGIPANCWGVKMASQMFGNGVLWKDYEHLIYFLL